MTTHIKTQLSLFMLCLSLLALIGCSKEETADMDSDELLDFMQKNAQREEVVVTDTGLQYEILQAAQGASPRATDRVRVHYEGRLITGEVFDSSIARGQSAEFGLQQVIAGWTEGLQHMQIGSRFRFYIPSELAYGAAGRPGVIPPDAVLIFDVELLGIN